MEPQTWGTLQAQRGLLWPWAKAGSTRLLPWVWAWGHLASLLYLPSPSEGMVSGSPGHPRVTVTVGVHLPIPVETSLENAKADFTTIPNISALLCQHLPRTGSCQAGPSDAWAPVLRAAFSASWAVSAHPFKPLLLQNLLCKTESQDWVLEIGRGHESQVKPSM